LPWRFLVSRTTPTAASYISPNRVGPVSFFSWGEIKASVSLFNHVKYVALTSEGRLLIKTTSVKPRAFTAWAMGPNPDDSSFLEARMSVSPIQQMSIFFMNCRVKPFGLTAYQSQVAEIKRDGNHGLLQCGICTFY